MNEIKALCSQIKRLPDQTLKGVVLPDDKIAVLKALVSQFEAMAVQIPNAAYCDQCGKTQPLIDEEMRKDDLNEHPWRDLTCSVCKLVINSVSHIAQLDTDDGGGE